MSDQVGASPESHKLTIPSTAEAGQSVQRELLDCMTRHEWDEKSAFAVRLALEEAMVNAIKHGNGNDPAKRIMFHFEVSPERLRIEIQDQGAGFDADAVPDPTLPENLERPYGRGVMLMRAYMSTVEFLGCGNRVVMTKTPESDADL